MRFITCLCVALVTAGIVEAEGTCKSFPNNADVEQKLVALSEAKAAVGEQIAQSILTTVPLAERNFCVNYELGRHFTRSKKFDEARGFLTDAIKNASFEDHSSFAVWNVVGFTYLQQKQFEKALENFEKQEGHSAFRLLSKKNRMKVYNNAGYTLIQLARYGEALDYLNHAAGLGSVLALKNIAIVESITETLEAEDKNIPGIFSAVVASSRTSSGVQPIIDTMASKLGAEADEFFVFRTSNGRYSISLGAYESYPRALERRTNAVSKGISDAYVASISEWADVTDEF